MLRINTKDVSVRARAVIVSFISAAGIYLSVTHHVMAIAVLVLNLASVFFLSDLEMFWQMLFLLPFTVIYKYSPASTSLFTYLSLFFVCKLLIKTVSFSRKFIVLLIVFAVTVLSGVGSALMSFVKILSNIFLLAYFVKVVDRKAFPSMILSVSLGEVIASFIGLRKTTWSALAVYFQSLKQEHIDGELVARFTGLYSDPNYYSIIVIICLYSLLLYMYKKEIDYKIGVPLFVALIAFGCMTYSRVFYIALAGVLAAILVLRFKNKSIVSTLILAALFGVVFVYYAEKSGIINNIIYRFQADDISSGRFYLWSLYLTEIFGNMKILFFGAGLNAGLLENTGVHNFYIETVYHIGLIGALSYYGLIFYILKVRALPVFKRSIVNWGLTVVVMFMFGTLGMLFQFDFVYILMLNWIVLNTDMKKAENVKNDTLEG